MGMQAERDHVVFNSNTQRLECQRCGESRTLPLPMLLHQAAEHLEAYAALHAQCVPGGPNPTTLTRSRSGPASR